MSPSLGSRLRPLLPAFRPYRLRVLLGIASIAAAAVVGLGTPLLVGRAVDELRREVSAATLLRYGGLLLAVAAVQGLFSFLQRRTLVAVSRDIEFDLRNQLFAHLERLHLGFFQRSYTGDLMARATNDLGAVRMLCGPAIMYGGNTIFVSLGALALMARIHGGLTLVALATMPLVALATMFFGQRIHGLFEKVQERFAALSTRAQENFAGVRVVRAYAQEPAEELAFDSLNRQYVESNRRLALWSAAFHPLLQALVGLGFVSVLAYGGALALRGTISVGELVTFNMFLGKLVWPMIAVGWVINLGQRGAASFGRLREILLTQPAVDDEEPTEVPALIRGAIEVRGLDFSYGEGGPPVLRDIDLRLPAGEVAALLGRTGSGKSTLMSLLTRLWNPPTGTVLVDGVDVRRWPLRELRSVIAVVPQETFLFSATLRDNVAFGRPEAPDAEIERALYRAGFEDDLEALPDGLDTRVGERGVTLSGGQKQRVALARALLREPRILLLDDCLSAVDTRTEEKILARLRQFFDGRTVLLVSHRVSTAQEADQILVLDRGRIVERGSHADLLARDGLYAELERRQRLEEELATA